MNTYRVNPPRGMSIRANLAWVLAGTLVCGLCIAGYFSWSLTNLKRMQYQVSSHSLALRELHSVSEHLDLLLVSSDLAIGSGETYTAQIAMSLINDLVQQTADIGIDSALPYDQRQIERLGELLAELGIQISLYQNDLDLDHDADRSDLLERFDVTSGELVRTFEKISATAEAFASRKSVELAETRGATTTFHVLALLLYFTANAVIVFWTLRRIAWPLEALIGSVDKSMSEGSPLAISVRGPLEMNRLAKHFARLVSQLEQKVRARTQELLYKTRKLEQEVTERKAIQEALELAKENAEKSSRVKSEFLSVMSHELRTPMNAVLGSLSLIRESGITPEQQEYVDLADESGKALMELLGEILDLSKIESGEIDLRNEVFSVNELLRTTVNMLASQANEKGLRLSVVVDPDIPASLIGDFSRMRQVLVNLVGNAIKFTDEGYVEIEISRIPDGEQPGSLRFSVTDTGIGVEDAECAEIFESFSQADSSLSREHTGVGLGLSICMKLARAMGGTCGVESTPGKGSTFWFAVALPSPADASESYGHMLSLQRKPSPVLLVENGDAFAAAWISKVLSMHQIPFTTLATSREAMVELAAAKQGSNPYECTIVPLQLHSSSDDNTASRLASSVHENGGRIIAAYSEMEFLAEEMVGNRLFDARHCGTVCQNEFLRAVLGDTEKEVEPLLRNPCKTLKTDHEHHAGTRVLIVEDSRANRLIAAAILQNSGFEVDVAGSGAEAIEIFEHTDFDLILMDLQMSGMDGFEATREIRKLKAPKNNTPIIAFSANVMEEIREQCSEAGMNDFVSKPFVKETLVEKITQWT